MYEPKIFFDFVWGIQYRTNAQSMYHTKLKFILANKNEVLLFLSPLLTKMKGFLVYHIPIGRRRFIDELFVAPHARRQGVARSMIQFICKGPIELIVRKGNFSALSLYNSLRFCSTDRGYYQPDDGELYMKTQSFRGTLSTLPSKIEHSCEQMRWCSIAEKERGQMIRYIMTEHSVNRSRAKDILQIYDNDTLYVIV